MRAKNQGRFLKAEPSKKQKKREKRMQQKTATIERMEERNSKKDIQKQSLKPQLRCVFCGGPHTPAACPIRVTKEERLQQLWRDNRCERCMRSGHDEVECNFKLPACKKCWGEAHYLALCPKYIEINRKRVQENLLKEKEGESSHHFRVETPRNKTTSGDYESEEEEKMQTSNDSGRKDGDEDESDDSEVPDFDGSTEDGTSDED